LKIRRVGGYSAGLKAGGCLTPNLDYKSY